MSDKKTCINDQIRAGVVVLITEDGENIGKVTRSRAMEIASGRGLDLIQVSYDSDNPVCKLGDYGKMLYANKKKIKENKKAQKTSVTKEIKFRPRTEKHDYETKCRHVRKFLEEGNKVKLTIFFKGREMAHPDLGTQMLERVVEDMSDISDVTMASKQEGKKMSMMISPKATKQ